MKLQYSHGCACERNHQSHTAICVLIIRVTTDESELFQQSK